MLSLTKHSVIRILLPTVGQFNAPNWWNYFIKKNVLNQFKVAVVSVKHLPMKTVLLTSALDVGEWSASRSRGAPWYRPYRPYRMSGRCEVACPNWELSVRNLVAIPTTIFFKPCPKMETENVNVSRNSYLYGKSSNHLTTASMGPTEIVYTAVT
jgi:hypothetical protein